ncbi:octanoyltransferase [Fulvitalea axinellae]|uniref:Octanoyltransferase n=1 Tax=Fulvitalea axinellae TaxID=1182444 RepID=A0AAU9CE40_9BACT|nr:octanoyltransferase [Fulvitalea axinellae]
MNHKINKRVKFLEWGTVDYKQAWDRQEELFKGIVDVKIANRKKEEKDQELTENFLIFCNHPHVYTLGKSGDAGNLLMTESMLKMRGIDYYHINRGGDITYHGPGQIVGYPILDLENFFTDIHKYMRFLEDGVIRTLADYGIEAGRIEGLTGVWLDFEKKIRPRKICAMGVKTSRWVSMHGLALNVNTELSYFNNIVPCGITDKEVTSMNAELGRDLDLKEVEDKLKAHLAELFEMVLFESEIEKA